MLAETRPFSSSISGIAINDTSIVLISLFFLLTERNCREAKQCSYLGETSVYRFFIDLYKSHKKSRRLLPTTMDAV